jgi:hypothetical protein
MQVKGEIMFTTAWIGYGGIRWLLLIVKKA